MNRKFGKFLQKLLFVLTLSHFAIAQNVENPSIDEKEMYIIRGNDTINDTAKSCQEMDTITVEKLISSIQENSSYSPDLSQAFEKLSECSQNNSGNSVDSEKSRKCLFDSVRLIALAVDNILKNSKTNVPKFVHVSNISNLSNQNGFNLTHMSSTTLLPNLNDSIHHTQEFQSPILTFDDLMANNDFVDDAGNKILEEIFDDKNVTYQIQNSPLSEYIYGVEQLATDASKNHIGSTDVSQQMSAQNYDTTSKAASDETSSEGVARNVSSEITFSSLLAESENETNPENSTTKISINALGNITTQNVDFGLPDMSSVKYTAVSYKSSGSDDLDVVSPTTKDSKNVTKMSQNFILSIEKQQPYSEFSSSPSSDATDTNTTGTSTTEKVTVPKVNTTAQNSPLDSFLPWWDFQLLSDIKTKSSTEELTYISPPSTTGPTYQPVIITEQVAKTKLSTFSEMLTTGYKQSLRTVTPTISGTLQNVTSEQTASPATETLQEPQESVVTPEFGKQQFVTTLQGLSLGTVTPTISGTFQNVTSEQTASSATETLQESVVTPEFEKQEFVTTLQGLENEAESTPPQKSQTVTTLKSLAQSTKGSFNFLNMFVPFEPANYEDSSMPSTFGTPTLEFSSPQNATGMTSITTEQTTVTTSGAQLAKEIRTTNESTSISTDTISEVSLAEISTNQKTLDYAGTKDFIGATPSGMNEPEKSKFGDQKHTISKNTRLNRPVTESVNVSTLLTTEAFEKLPVSVKVSAKKPKYLIFPEPVSSKREMSSTTENLYNVTDIPKQLLSRSTTVSTTNQNDTTSLATTFSTTTASFPELKIIPATEIIAITEDDTKKFIAVTEDAENSTEVSNAPKLESTVTPTEVQTNRADIKIMNTHFKNSTTTPMPEEDCTDEEENLGPVLFPTDKGINVTHPEKPEVDNTPQDVHSVFYSTPTILAPVSYVPVAHSFGTLSPPNLQTYSTHDFHNQIILDPYTFLPTFSHIYSSYYPIPYRTSNAANFRKVSNFSVNNNKSLLELLGVILSENKSKKQNKF